MVWITYNGEIYNHVELRLELEQLGHRFISTSDTEVMLAAYAEWGEACVQRFNGMFAFVIIDRHRRVAWAVRDRFGVKPLYWWQAPDGAIAIASEIKQFSALVGWRARLNGQRARDFLIAGAYEHTDETLFVGVRQLRGGQAMRVSLDRRSDIGIERWYNLRGAPFSGDFEQAKVAFRDLLTDAVQLRLRADVSIGSCLSGGLDSSAIVCLASNLRGASNGNLTQSAFSALSDAPRYDERRFAQAVVRHAQVKWHTVTPSPDELIKQLDELVWAQDEPFGSTSVFAQSAVFRLANESGVKVMLDGQGADEILGGYPVFRGAAIAELAMRLRLVAMLQELQVAPSGSLRLAASALGPTLLLEMVRSRRAAGSASWLDHSRLGVPDNQRYLAASASARRDFNSLSPDQLLESNLPALLHWEDRSSMSHSVEARVPFLDYRLVEFVLGLPTKFKFNNGLGKRVLREALAGVVPEMVLRRTDKIGFQLAEDEWSCERPDFIRGLLADSVRASDGVIRSGVLELFDQFVAGARPYSFLFWRIISFGCWMQRFHVDVA
jgi:asparagine synthase (glutamine-hydrolysing)